jgi:hypothetical protein
MASYGIHGAVDSYADLPDADILDLNTVFLVRQDADAPSGAGLYWVRKDTGGKAWAYLDGLSMQTGAEVPFDGSGTGLSGSDLQTALAELAGQLAPASTEIHVDGSRAGEGYVEDGSPLRPYTTIMGAVNAVIAAGDNAFEPHFGPPKPYVIRVTPWKYTETIVLESETLKNLHFVSTSPGSENSGVIVRPPAGEAALRSVRDNRWLATLFMSGFDFRGPVRLECPVDCRDDENGWQPVNVDASFDPSHSHSQTFGHQFFLMSHCTFSHPTTVTAGGTFSVFHCMFHNTLAMRNVFYMLFQDSTLEADAEIEIDDTQAADNPVPYAVALRGYGYWILANTTVYGTLRARRVGSGYACYVQPRSGRYGNLHLDGGTEGKIFGGAALHPGATVTLDGGSTLENAASWYDGNASGLPAANLQEAVDLLASDGMHLGYADGSDDGAGGSAWSGAPASVKEALDRLATAVCTLSGGAVA